MKVGKLVMAAAPLIAALYASPSLADPITVTLVSPGSTTVTEGDSITLVFQVTNSGSGAYAPDGNGFNYTFVSGDSTDGPPSLDSAFNYSPAGYTACGASLAAGSSCYYSATIDTPAESGETDGDSGTWSVLTQTGWFLPGVPIDYVSTFTDVTIQDPVISSVPEPGTLALFASTLLGLGLLLQLRLRKSN